MPTILRNILVLLMGIAIGYYVNTGILMLSPILTPPPEGMDVTNAASVKEHLHLIGPKYYIIPFIADAVGTLLGACFVASFTLGSKLKWAIAVGVFFMILGITNLVTMRSPMWFTIINMSLAFLPMAFLGYQLRRQ